MICHFYHQHSLLQKTLSFCFGCAFILLVLQWEILQVGVWANMIRDYTAETNLQQAVADTFSGEKPCERCKQLTRSQTRPGDHDTYTNLTPLPPELDTPNSFALQIFPPGVRLHRILLIAPSDNLRSPPLLPPPIFFLS